MAFAVLVVVFPTHLLAQCVDQPRSVALDPNNGASLKSYLCTAGVGADASKFRVEYYRLSDGAVSFLLVDKSSAMLQKTLDAAKLVPNEVSRTYADLVERFGETADVPNNDHETGDLSFTVSPADHTSPSPDGAADQKPRDKTGVKTLRTLIGFWGAPSDDYPAVAEIEALKRKTIPSNLGYYYSFSGSAKDPSSNGCDQQDFTCKKIRRWHLPDGLLAPSYSSRHG